MIEIKESIWSILRFAQWVILLWIMGMMDSTTISYSKELSLIYGILILLFSSMAILSAIIAGSEIMKSISQEVKEK